MLNPNSNINPNSNANPNLNPNCAMLVSYSLTKWRPLVNEMQHFIM